ncbi:small-conductance mechanosensitive channel [Erwinia toletana]|uniref:Small-conductance mechanosensitive channel n=1 Tax=Winslowiella toletana TaxID=92490 RepID=A0ABS4P8K6_9GAMM|nr:hypothetical protein [Winslowiella toletana]MBP2168976.1 small-conductance mechanosensitive channel [Winslowiella toletana]
MQSELVVLRNKLLAFVACAVFLCLMMGLVYIDVNWMNNALHETSFTEGAQELILAIIAASFFIAAIRHAEYRAGLQLIGGFYACMLIREMDFLFDEIRHGAWVWFALAVTAICLTYALLHLQKCLRGLVHLLQHPAWNMMAAGLLTILVFSRLFGVNALWQHLMLDGYHRTVKNMAEEGSELLGYSFCLFASVRYLWAMKTVPEKKSLFEFQQQN